MLGHRLWVCLCVCEYLTSCLDAEDGHPCLWVTLELVDQLDSFRGWDAAVDTDISSLEQQRQGNKIFKLLCFKAAVISTFLSFVRGRMCDFSFSKVT